MCSARFSQEVTKDEILMQTTKLSYTKNIQLIYFVVAKKKITYYKLQKRFSAAMAVITVSLLLVLNLAIQLYQLSPVRNAMK